MYLLVIGLITIFKVLSEISAQTNFIVHTDECKIPYFDAFSKEATVVFAPQNYTSCTDSDILTFTTIKNNTAYLHLKNENKILHKSEEPLSCCYSYVERGGSEEEPDVGISISNCTEFNETIKLEGEIVMVKCTNSSGLVYENVHNPITVTEEVENKLTRTPIKNTHHKPFSVLIIVIDSVSRLNFKRTMPETRRVVLRQNFTEFMAYNKVDDNTFPNAMALLSGLTLKQTYSMCDPKEIGKLDECPMIWYDYKKLGYVTAYAEDWANISTFNYYKKGFLDPPTDYYFKPYVEAAESLTTTTKDNMLYCTGPETEGERILNLAKDFAITFKKKPSFGVFWMNTFSHNNINSPMGMDEKVAEFFNDLIKHGILKESIVMLLSDHGIRFGTFRQSIQGWFEEKLPMNYISVPPLFKKMYPQKYDNLVDNANKLISTYDLYMTLQDILKMSVNKFNISSSLACPKCQSLFSNIKRNRSCREAGIPEAWCTCVSEFTTDDHRLNNEVINQAAQLALEEIKLVEYFEPYSKSVTNIFSAAVNLNRLRKSYLLIVLQTDSQAIYQILFRIRGDPVEFVRIVKTMRLY